MSHDSTKKTITVALGVCLVCSVLVSSAAVGLNSIQTANKKLDKIKNILAAGDLKSEGQNPETIYKEKVKPIVIEVKSGDVLPESKYDEFTKPESFDIKSIVQNPDYSTAIAADQDIAGIKKKPNYMVIYEILGKENEVEKFILPIYGKGLWSTLYGFLALDKDLQTVKGITFYEHGETPGLGGEVDNPKWKASWNGKQAIDENGQVVIEILKGIVDPTNPNANRQIDGLSGSTLTTRGVDHLVKYWLSEQGYGPFLAKMKKDGADEKI
ncbi:MAG: Na(+)-translocating NADH-quinone reductase subunit C [Ignavibacteriae bacterium HGW-Ignavibacteriae-2]|jgi:Na+-transporting NADH:ubiquinone oxidoreductase subunit C|nr:MAG: Na(+)-translocating NADH-quinone reductase subunit C [Ignavibacteriae bacterium HGW-Ignavibacteriae-2]